MTLSGKETPDRHKEPDAVASAWAPFRNPVFRLLMAGDCRSVIIGGWMLQRLGEASLMTSLNADPLMVSLVQAASSVPLFLFALPASATWQTSLTSAVLSWCSRSSLPSSR